MSGNKPSWTDEEDDDELQKGVRKWSEIAHQHMMKRRRSGVTLTAEQAVRRVRKWNSDSYRKKVFQALRKLVYGFSETSSSEEEEEEEERKPQYDQNVYNEENQDEYQSDGWLRNSESEDDEVSEEGGHTDSDGVNPNNILPEPSDQVRNRRYVNVSRQARAFLDDKASDDEGFEDDSSGDSHTFGGSTSPSEVTSIDTNDDVSTLKEKVNRKKRKAESEEDYDPTEDDETEDDETDDDENNNDKRDGGQTTLQQSFAFSVLKDK